jgi:photosystem II stability/assembly factor-like uncharacterized protein
MKFFKFIGAIGMRWSLSLSCALALPCVAAASDEPRLTPAALTRTVLLSAARSGDMVIAVSNQGDILLRSSSDKAWRYAKTPASGPLTALSFDHAGHGVAVGHRATILRTRDGGTNWQLVNTGINPRAVLLDVVILDTQQAVAVGAFGLYLRSTDGGQSWEQVQINKDDTHLNAIAKDENNQLVIVGENGVVYRSADMGRSWIPSQSGVGASLLGVFSTAPNHFTAFGVAGNIISSTDGGATWRRQASDTRSVLTGGAVLSDGSTVIVSATGSTLFEMADAQGYRTINTEVGQSYSSVLADGKRDLLIFGVNGVKRLSLPATTGNQHGD